MFWKIPNDSFVCFNIEFFFINGIIISEERVYGDMTNSMTYFGSQTQIQGFIHDF